MYVQSNLLKRKTSCSSLKTEVGAGSHYMKEEEIVDDSQHSACSILRKAGRTAISKYVKEITSLCSIFDMDFGNLPDEHCTSMREDRSGKENLVLADRLYTIRRGRKDGHKEFEVFGSNGMKCNAKVLGNLVKVTTHSACSPLLNNCLSRKILLLTKKTSKPKPGKILTWAGLRANRMRVWSCSPRMI